MEFRKPSSEKKREWDIRARQKDAIVPEFFEVFPNKVHITCGNCGCNFKRPLIMNLDEPTFICPNEECRAKNWIPLKYDIK